MANAVKAERTQLCRMWMKWNVNHNGKIADAIPTPSDKSPSLQTRMSLDKRSDNTTANTVLENPLQTPLEKQAAAKSFEALATTPAFWSSTKEEFIGPSLRISKSDSTFHNQASVETLYVSPSFKTFDPVKEMVIKKDPQKPAPSSMVQMDDEGLQPLPTWVSTVSEGTSSFSTLSVSPPDSTSPEKSVQLLPPILTGPSFWALSHQPASSASFKDKDKTAWIHHAFAPRDPLSSDEEANDNLNLPEILPDSSDSTKNETSDISNANWVDFSIQNVEHFTSVSGANFQTRGLPREPESNNSTNVLLGEVRNAIVNLHADLSVVIQELHAINSHLVSLSGTSQQVSTSLQGSQSSEGSSDPI
ncbi:PREDICTED: ENTH domain-containing protein 1 [Chrysochloris asiatica]|uniref:ENTH domain-containing protein 1 n=1 Tax=Chrysochloris asiatica TaxID=185453 RepID=A0A9B0WS73_CHRAS|nr:PREDICTED: ENTH domain-containing protein 1 [Chrysochloris asiatica]